MLPQSTAAMLVNSDAELCISSQVGLEAHPLDHLAYQPIPQNKEVGFFRKHMHNNRFKVDLQDIYIENQFYMLKPH